MFVSKLSLRNINNQKLNKSRSKSNQPHINTFNSNGIYFSGVLKGNNEPDYKIKIKAKQAQKMAKNLLKRVPKLNSTANVIKSKAFPVIDEAQKKYEETSRRISLDSIISFGNPFGENMRIINNNKNNRIYWFNNGKLAHMEEMTHDGTVVKSVLIDGLKPVTIKEFNEGNGKNTAYRYSDNGEIESYETYMGKSNSDKIMKFNEIYKFKQGKLSSFVKDYAIAKDGTMSYDEKFIFDDGDFLAWSKKQKAFIKGGYTRDDEAFFEPAWGLAVYTKGAKSDGKRYAIKNRLSFHKGRLCTYTEEDFKRPDYRLKLGFDSENELYCSSLKDGQCEESHVYKNIFA